MTNTEFKAELRKLINGHRMKLLRLKKENNSELWKESLNRSHEMLDKLEQDYFHTPTINVDIDISNIKKFDEDGNLINEGEKEMSTTEQVKEGLLKVFNELIENGEYNIGHCDFDNEKFSTSLCQIADRLLQIESDKRLSQEYFKNCVIS